MKLPLLLGALAWAVTSSPAPAAQGLLQKHDALRAEVAVTTMPAAELDTLAPSQSVEHDTEVARGEAVTLIVTIQACEADEQGTCHASTDVVLHRPDGSVHSEMKGLSLASGRTRTDLRFAASDPVGVYRVVATVRDPVARRFASVERLFGLKD